MSSSVLCIPTARTCHPLQEPNPIQLSLQKLSNEIHENACRWNHDHRRHSMQPQRCSLCTPPQKYTRSFQNHAFFATPSPFSTCPRPPLEMLSRFLRPPLTLTRHIRAPSSPIFRALALGACPSHSHLPLNSTLFQEELVLQLLHQHRPTTPCPRICRAFCATLSSRRRM